MAGWNALAIEEQERVIGRTKLSDIELPDDVKPPDSHVALTTIVDDDGTERQIVRANMPFATLATGERGTYFIGYAAHPDVLDRMLVNMFVGDPPRTTDRVLDFSTATTGSLFFVPTQDFLDDLPPGPAAAAAAPTDHADGSLAIGSLRQ
jgi:putative iron-dependent peroxidase